MKLKPFFPTCKLICPKQLITFHTCSSTMCEKGYKSKKINGEGKIHMRYATLASQNVTDCRNKMSKK